MSGEAGIVVGTHALIQDRVEFAELGLVVVDEQHRFGVEQRDALRGRGEKAPHLLVMTATPIPRTVAMTVYGDLEVSALRELPGGRSPIATTVVPAGEKPAWLERVWARIREEVAAGHQVYVVCPRVGGDDAGKEEELPDDPDSGLDAAGAGSDERRAPLAVLDVEPKLAEGPLAGLRLGVLHGKLPPDEKDAVMRAFDAGEHRRARRHHGRRGRRGRAERHGDGDPRRGPVRAVPAAPAARAGGPRLGARGVPAGDGRAGGHHGARAAGRGGEHHGRVRAGPDGPRAAPGGRRARLAAVGTPLGPAAALPAAPRGVIAKARMHATEIVAADPGLHRHPGLHALVAETVGDEERAAYLDKV